MNHRPILLGDLFHSIVWMVALPLAGCGSTVTSGVATDAGAEAAVDVGVPTDRSTPVDVPPADAPVDSPNCAPRLAADSPGTCEETVEFPCGLPPGTPPDAGNGIPYDQCNILCAATRSGGASGCRLLPSRGDGADRIGCTTCAIGRRAEGLGPIAGAPDAGPVGDFFARVATLEWASVTAFERLADDLARHGAPHHLVAEALRSADDERRHTSAMGALARRFGAPVRAPDFTETGMHSLEALARENATEGCVRETFGALVATWQARAAQDPGVARALREIAADETRHAEFSWSLQGWVDAVLDPDARARVDAARESAAAALWAELDATVDPALVTVAGMPDRGTARALFSAMTSALS